MKVFSKENSILGRKKRHERRHIGLIWPPSSPFFTMLPGNYQKGMCAAISHCPAEEGKLWAYEAAPCSLSRFIYIPCTFFTWTISDSWTGQEFSFTTELWIWYSTLSYILPSHSHFGLILPHPLEFSWEGALMAKRSLTFPAGLDGRQLRGSVALGFISITILYLLFWLAVWYPFQLINSQRIRHICLVLFILCNHGAHYIPGNKNVWMNERLNARTPNNCII